MPIAMVWVITGDGSWGGHRSATWYDPTNVLETKMIPTEATIFVVDQWFVACVKCTYLRFHEKWNTS